jgi:hypothetical protein
MELNAKATSVLLTWLYTFDVSIHSDGLVLSGATQVILVPDKSADRAAVMLT